MHCTVVIANDVMHTVAGAALALLSAHQLPVTSYIAAGECIEKCRRRQGYRRRRVRLQIWLTQLSWWYRVEWVLSLRVSHRATHGGSPPLRATHSSEISVAKLLPTLSMAHRKKIIV